MTFRFAARLKCPAFDQHGSVLIDLRQVLSQVVQPSLLFEVMIVDASHGVVTIALLGINIAIVVKPVAAGNRIHPHFTNEAGLGNVFLALVTVEEEDEVVVEPFLGLPFHFPGVAQ